MAPPPAEQLARKYAAVTGDDLVTGIDQDRDVKAERFDASRNLTNLSRAVDARILQIEFELRDRAVSYLNRMIRTTPQLWLTSPAQRPTPPAKRSEPH